MEMNFSSNARDVEPANPSLWRCFDLTCVGPIPPEISQLKNLQELRLKGNNLTGQHQSTRSLFLAFLT